MNETSKTGAVDKKTRPFRPLSSGLSLGTLLFNRFASVLFLLLTGCQHLGPKAVAVDRFDCTAIADSWKQQTLLYGNDSEVC